MVKIPTTKELVEDDAAVRPLTEYLVAKKLKAIKSEAKLEGANDGEE